MIKVNIQFFGGRGGAGGKGGGGGSTKAGVTESFTEGSYINGAKIKYRETDSRFTVQDTGERIPRSANKVLDQQRKNNSDGTATVTNIVQGSKGNLYAVDYTYRPRGDGNTWVSEIRKVKRKK